MRGSTAKTMNKPRERTRRGVHYRALAEGYAILNLPVADSFHRAADHYDNNDPPFDLVTPDSVRKVEGRGDDK